jgi:peptidylprolyl isomerase
VHRLRTALLITLATVASVAVACGGDDDGSDASSTGSTDSSVNATAHACEEDLSKPVVRVPDEKPTELVVEDIEEGDGPTAEAGDALAIHYVGVSFSTKQEFDSSWVREPLITVLPEPNLIEGWNEGILGMKLCGRRQLVIPPELGYGEEGQGAIAPNETLVFVIDLVGLTKDN